MDTPRPDLAASRNYVLSSLPPGEAALLLPHLTRVELPHRFTFYRSGEPITHVHFIERGCASVITLTPEGAAVEVGTIGNEGLVGTPILLASDSAPSNCEMQVPGDGWRMPAGALAGAMGQSDALRTRLLRFAQAHFNQVAQSAACNRLHSLEERCARWLLMTRDRTGESFGLTHEYLAIMLGVRRAGVTVALGTLQQAGLIRATRGNIAIVDPEGLEEASCGCYRVVRAEFDRLVRAPG